MKKIVVIVLSVFLLTGCFSNKTNQDDGTKRIYLTSSYYNKGEFIKVDDLTTLESDTYVLFTYNNFCNLAYSFSILATSFLGNNSNFPLSFIASISAILLILSLTVLKLVKRPPSHLSVT